MKRVDGNEVGLYDGIAHIIWDNKGKTIYITASEYGDTFLSLNDCLKEIGYTDGVCIVIMEYLLSGKVYIYGNYEPNEWWEYGKTEGFA